MFHLSGAINVLLLLIIRRPGLLLFPRPEELDEQEIPLTPQGAGPAIFSETAKSQRSPEPTSAALGDRESKDSPIPSHVNSRRNSDDN
jgi:hypothetical protein